MSRVKLTLGEKVQFKGFGLSGNITGSLTALEEEKELTSGQGELNIKKGKYKAYGQELEIEKGRLLFSGGPVDNPALDVRAIRRVQNVIAGVHIRGTLKKPELILYSEPPMDQADALSYLLFGRPLHQASGSEGQQLYDAALSAGLSQGGLLAKKIGAVFGIEDVALEKGTTPQESMLFIGKYISPKLYFSYGIGLFEPLNTVRARYNLTDHWLIQTEHGTQSGGDILYGIER